jgi:hypothetical protein
MLSLPKAFYGFGEEARNVSLLGHIALHGDGITALGGDFLDDFSAPSLLDE